MPIFSSPSFFILPLFAWVGCIRYVSHYQSLKLCLGFLEEKGKEQNIPLWTKICYRNTRTYISNIRKCPHRNVWLWFRESFPQMSAAQTKYQLLTSSPNGLFQKINGVDVKFWLFNVALENWQTVQMSPGKKARKNIFSPGIICF